MPIVQFLRKYFPVPLPFLRATMLWGLLAVAAPVQAIPYITMVGGNPIDGSQLTVNNFGVAGQMGGFTASGNYRYLLFRSGQFTTQNLTFSVNAVAWGPNNLRFFSSNTTYNVSLAGIIPYGTDCGLTETIVMKIYNISGQEVLSHAFIIRNPIQAIPVAGFKIYGSPATFPTLITACGAAFKNILQNNIKLQYTGTGTVQKYQIRIEQASSSGAPVPGGHQFVQNWTAGPVPLFLNLKTLIGATTGLPPSTWTYYRITLETVGGPCSGGSGIHSAFVLLSPKCCPK